MNYKDVKYYQMEIYEVEKELRHMPEGYLIKRGKQYYIKTETCQKGISRNPKLVMQLARKAYLLRRLKNLEHNLNIAQKHFKRFKTEKANEIISELSPFYQTLPHDYFFHSSVYDQQSRVAKGNPNYPEKLVYLTEAGFNVRSKSERTIANALFQSKIPFWYDSEFMFGGTIRYPDFTIIRPFDGKTFLWEHLGLIDHKEYRQSAIDKLALYAQNGFLPFDNLICTYEEDVENPEKIQALIELFLLQ